MGTIFQSALHESVDQVDYVPGSLDSGELMVRLILCLVLAKCGCCECGPD